MKVQAGWQHMMRYSYYSYSALHALFILWIFCSSRHNLLLFVSVRKLLWLYMLPHAQVARDAAGSQVVDVIGAPVGYGDDMCHVH